MLTARFAPSPTGYLHLGHAYSALFAWRRAREGGGRFLLRIEDIDRSRCREELTSAILEDLAWLGLDSDGEVRHQSEHFADYRSALERLEAFGVVYPCFCTRADIAREIAGAQSAPHGPDGPLYPGTCRRLSSAERNQRISTGIAYALRLDAVAGAERTGPLEFIDETHGTVAVNPRLLGDVVVARKDTPTSYHLAVTIDDHLQGVTLVTRGDDLLPATHVHVLLQHLLGFATPAYAHHRLIEGEDGKRLSKRDRSLTLRELRATGVTAREIHDRLAVGAAWLERATLP